MNIMSGGRASKSNLSRFGNDEVAQGKLRDAISMVAAYDPAVRKHDESVSYHPLGESLLSSIRKGPYNTSSPSIIHEESDSSQASFFGKKPYQPVTQAQKLENAAPKSKRTRNANDFLHRRSDGRLALQASEHEGNAFL